MEKIKQLAEKVKGAVGRICETIRNIKSEYDFYKGLWDEPEGKAAVSNLKTQAFYLLKKIKPSKIEGNMVLGTGDPASTGQMIGAIAAFYGLFPEKLHIVPDFEEKKLEGSLHVKGKLRLIHVAVIAVRLAADQNVRYAIKKIQSKEGVRNEHEQL